MFIPSVNFLKRKLPFHLSKILCHFSASWENAKRGYFHSTYQFPKKETSIPPVNLWLHLLALHENAKKGYFPIILPVKIFPKKEISISLHHQLSIKEIPMGCTMLYNPWPMGTEYSMIHGLYNVVRPMGHGKIVIYKSIVQSMTHGNSVLYDPWVVQCRTTHGPWENSNCLKHCMTHDPWELSTPWPMGCTMSYDPWPTGK